MDYINKKIEDICDFSGGSQPPKSTFIHEKRDGYVRLIQIRDRLNDEHITYIPEKYANKTCIESDILIGRYGPPIFQIFRGFKGAYNVAILKAIPKKNIDSDYLFYFLQQESILHYVEKMAMRTAGQWGVDIDGLNQYPVKLPNLDYQQKIAKILSDIDRKINLNKKINDELEIFARELYDYWFLQFDFTNDKGTPYKSSGGKMIYNNLIKNEIPEGWEVKELKKCLNHITTGLNPRDNFKLGNGNIKYITVKNLTTNGVIDFTGCDVIDDKACAMVHERSQITKGDILFASISPLGRCYIIQEQPKDWDINESVFSISPNQKIVSPEYLYCYLTSQWFKKKAEREATGSIFAGIRIASLYEMPIIIPPEKIMKQITNQLRPLFQQKDKFFNEILELTKLRDELLPLLMNGQVEVK